MELTYATIVILASLVFVLSGMVGYLYWQQTRMLQHIQSLAIVVSTHFTQPPLMPDEEPEDEKEVVEKPVADEEDANQLCQVKDGECPRACACGHPNTDH